MSDAGYGGCGLDSLQGGVVDHLRSRFGCWLYCVGTYGFLLGVGLGWLPSAIVGAIVATLWPLLILGVLLLYRYLG